MSQYKVTSGPECFLPPAAASMGNVLPDPGQAHIEGRIVEEGTHDALLQKAGLYAAFWHRQSGGFLALDDKS